MVARERPEVSLEELSPNRHLTPEKRTIDWKKDNEKKKVVGQKDGCMEKHFKVKLSLFINHILSTTSIK